MPKTIFLTHTDLLKQTQRYANIGLYGSLTCSVATLLLFMLWNRRFYINDYGHRFVLIAGSVLSVLAIASILLTVRRNIPYIRQQSDIEKRAKLYAAQTRNLYLGSLFVVVLLCILITLSHESILFMLLMLQVLTLIMLYPNSLRIKSDLGLTDDDTLGSL